MIRLLSKETIDKIAAGEVIERPESVVKELLDNAIDSGADKISVEIRGGGTELIRVTDNGCGIEGGEIRTAFLRHATSKLQSAEDLRHIRTMGFRGEALASISAVSRTELISRTRESISGFRYEMAGGEEKEFSEIGAPEGTTVVVRDLFYNVPARKEFLRSAASEGAAVTDMVEKAALCHPEIAFTYIMDRRTVFATPGSGKPLEVIYKIYGRDISMNLLELDFAVPETGIRLHGLIGKPVISRARRDMEIYFVNGRYIRSRVIERAIEEGYGGHMMQHRFPFVLLYIDMDPELTDVNVHPKKMEVRFSDEASVFEAVSSGIRKRLREEELIIEAGAEREEKRKKEGSAPALSNISGASGPVSRAEPFEERKQQFMFRKEEAFPKDGRKSFMFMEAAPDQAAAEQVPEGQSLTERSLAGQSSSGQNLSAQDQAGKKPAEPSKDERRPVFPDDGPVEQLELPKEVFLSEKAYPQFRMIGQVFGTYWIIEYDGYMYMIDQHAAHEKVNYERLMERVRNRRAASQYIYPPIMMSLSAAEAEAVEKSMEVFAELGYEIEEAGGREIIVRAVPSDLPELSRKELLSEIIASLCEAGGSMAPEILRDRIASMSCKAAVKGNSELSEAEMRALIGELLSLQDPYNCPHGRPTIARWSRYDLDKIFKRIV